MRKTSIYIGLLVMTCVALAQNFPVIDHITIGSNIGYGRVEATVIVPEFVRYRFDVLTSVDINHADITVRVVVGPNSVPVVWVDKTADPNGWRNTYDLQWTPPSRGTYNIDITATDTTATCRPQVVKGAGIITATPMLDPTYDYSRARTDQKAYQQAVKHTQSWQRQNGVPITYGNLFRGDKYIVTKN